MGKTEESTNRPQMYLAGLTEVFGWIWLLLLIADLEENVLEHRVLGEFDERSGNFPGGGSGRTHIPDGKRRHAVRMDVLRRLEQFREASEPIASGGLATSARIV
jgi:hypothetical protein